jgi:hypothetical protein
MRFALAAFAVVVAATAASAAAQGQPTRQFVNANCQKLTDACTDPIAKALNDAAKAGKIPAKCVAGRPPMPAMTLDIALWWVGHHDLDSKPVADASVLTAERLWPCARAMQ